MASPSPAAVAAIRSRVSDWTPGDAAIAASLNAPSLPNPVAVAPQLPRDFTFAELMGLLLPASVAAIRALPTAVDLIAKVNARDRASVLTWIGALQAAPAIITPAEAAAVAGLLTATVADPSWSALIPWSVSALGRTVDDLDIAASRPGA